VPGGTQPQTLLLTPADFVPTDEKAGPLTSWSQIDVLGLCGFHPDQKPDQKPDAKTARQPTWDGPLPEFQRLEWRR
jgi:hypothetical protein